MKKLFILLLSLFLYNIALPQEAKTLYKEAKKLSKAENHQGAIDKLTKAISKDKEYRDAFLLRAQSYAALKQNQQAVIDYKIAASQYPKKKSVQYETGLTFFTLGKYKEAIPYLDKVSHDIANIFHRFIHDMNISFFTTYTTFRTLVNTKDKIPIVHKSEVYKVTCSETNCSI